MLPTAPRRGCLAPSGRGLWRGAGRRVASSPPGGVRFESVPRAASCVTDLHSLVCGLGRAVSASAKPRAQDRRSATFRAKSSVIPRRHLPGFCVVLFALRLLRLAALGLGIALVLWSANRRREKGKIGLIAAARHKLSKHRCARLLDSVISCRAILEVSSGSVSKQAPRGRTTDAWSGRATAARVERAAVLPSCRGLPRRAAGGAAARPAHE